MNDVTKAKTAYAQPILLRSIFGGGAGFCKSVQVFATVYFTSTRVNRLILGADGSGCTCMHPFLRLVCTTTKLSLSTSCQLLDERFASCDRELRL